LTPLTRQKQSLLQIYWLGKATSMRILFYQSIGLLNVAQIDKLVDKLFSVNVPAFDKGGHLSVVLRARAASLIMNHRQLTGKFPGNAISSHLYEAAPGARIVDPQFLDLSPDLVLD
jgi:tryptophanase